MKNTKKNPTRRYNWHPDLPDHRDFLFSEMLAPTRATKLPRSVDLTPRCSPVFNQGKIGSCTGNALAGALEFLELKQLKEEDGTAEPEVFDPKKFSAISRLFIYYNERVIEGTTQQDGGAMIRDGVKSLTDWGACREATWKYASTQVLKKPSAKAYTEAKKHAILNYVRLENFEDMKQCLSSGFPIAFGFTVFESFESPQVAKSGIMPLPKAGEARMGGHAVLAVGYDDSSKQIIVRNSWGTEWGQNGYFRMPYAYIGDLGLAQDFWTIRK